MAAFQEPVYIVDDDLSFGKSLKRLLNARGLTADCFSSAQSFLDSVSPGQREGIAIVDINMPGCDGFELMDKMHDLGFCLPVIVITGKHQKGLHSCAMQRGARGYLQKPFSEGSLLELIETITDQKLTGRDTVDQVTGIYDMIRSRSNEEAE